MAMNGSRIMVRLEETSDMPILALNNKPIQNFENKTISQINLRLYES